MAIYKGKAKRSAQARTLQRFQNKLYWDPKTMRRPGQVPDVRLVPLTSSAALVNRSPARAVYQLRTRLKIPTVLPRNRQTFSPFNPPPGLRVV